MSGATWCIVGSYTSQSTPGITVHEVDGGGGLHLRSAITDIADASFITVSPDGQLLYAVSETAPEGAVVAFRIDPADGSLHEIDRAPSHGAAPCHLALDPRGRFLYVAHYGSGTVAAVALAADGRFGETTVAEHRGAGPHQRQEAPHVHCVVPAPDGRSLHVVDLGTDSIVRYEPPVPGGAWTAAGHVETPAGAGPRHLLLDPERHRAFALAELDCTLLAFELEPTTGALHLREVVPVLPDGLRTDSLAAAIDLHPNGDHLHVSVRGDDVIATFDVGVPGATPRLLGHVSSGGRSPRHLTLDPSATSMYVANQDSDTVTRFVLDPVTGMPQPAGTVTEISRPVCIVFVEVGG